MDDRFGIRATGYTALESARKKNRGPTGMILRMLHRQEADAPCDMFMIFVTE